MVAATSGGEFRSGAFVVSETAINLDLAPSPALPPERPARLASREIKSRRVEFLGVAGGAAVL